MTKTDSEGMSKGLEVTRSGVIRGKVRCPREEEKESRYKG